MKYCFLFLSSFFRSWKYYPLPTARILIATMFLIGFSFMASGQSARANMFVTDEMPTSTRLISVESLEHRVFELVNEERIKYGVHPLIWTDGSAAAARYHSTSMAFTAHFSHSDIIGNKVDDRVDKFGVKGWRMIGENIAWVSGYEDPAARVVNRWMNSPGHRENILQAKFREGGIGAAISEDRKFYFTQVFVRR